MNDKLKRFGAVRLLSPNPYVEVGSPYGGKVAPNGNLIAVFATGKRGCWAGRMLPARSVGSSRLTLFDASLNTCLGICDGIHYSIHDVAFHPAGTWMAIATGDYDGGYAYEGETILWNWRTGERRSLFASSRFAMRCRFDDLCTLTVLLTEEIDEAEEEYFSMTIEDVLRRSEVGPINIEATACEPETQGFSDTGPRWPPRKDSWGILPRIAAKNFDPSFGVWDVAWWSDTELAVAADLPTLAVYRLIEGTTRRHEFPSAQGVQLLKGYEDMNLLHVFIQEGNVLSEGHSQLMVASSDGLTRWEQFDRAYLFSVGRSGQLLGRATGAFPDITLSGRYPTPMPMHLGHFDIFNHALQVKNSRQGYSLVGTAPKPWTGKWLCALGERGLERFMDWDAEGHRMYGLAAVCNEEKIFVRASYLHAPTKELGSWTVDAFDVSDGWAKCWTWTSKSPVTSLATPIKHLSWVVVGTADSTVSLLSTETGAVLDQLILGDGRTRVVPTAMDVSPDGRHLAVGSADGRVWIVDLCFR